MRSSVRYLLAAGVVAVAAVALLLDLYNQGLAWRVLYNVTGEESPPAQIVGATHYAGRWFRQQPQTAPYAPIEHADVNPFGINTFLEQEADPVKRERIAEMISEAGFVWLRQEFPWEDIEIAGRGDFEDRRNDLDGDGQPDAISAWAKYDEIVSLTEDYDLRLLVRLSNPPSWTHADPAIGEKAPPDDLDDYINFVSTVAERYQGRVQYYQIWNEPNVYPEWGEQQVNPEAYTEMLCRSYATLKLVDPEIVVVSAALAPTNAMNLRDLNDFVYLQRMLDAGAGECFDVLAMQGYGLNSGPTDRRMRPFNVTYARPLYIRDMLVNNGYPQRAIWISEAAWNPVPDPDEVAEIDARYNFGQVTEAQAARYAVGGYERLQREWSFAGPSFYWFFNRRDESEANQSFYYFRMVEPDLSPQPVYTAMSDYINNLTPTLYRGVHQAEHYAIQRPDAQLVDSPTAQFEEALQAREVSFIADGTELAVRWQNGGAIEILSDGQLVQRLSSDDPATNIRGGWHEVRVPLSWRAVPHEIRIVADDDTLLLDSVTVYDGRLSDAFVIGGLAALVVALMGTGGYFLYRRAQEPMA